MDATEKDQMLGADLALGFFVVGAPAALIVGYLVDVTNRVRLATVVFGMSALACLATYFTTTYWQLYAVRAVTGIGIGGSQPLVYSLLADLYPAHQRTLANTLVGIAASTGVAAGQLVAGEVGTADRLGWRAPFALMSMPALLAVALLLLVAREPARGAGEAEFRRQSQGSSRDGAATLCTPLIDDPEAAVVIADVANHDGYVDTEGDEGGGVHGGDSKTPLAALLLDPAYSEAPTHAKLLAMFQTRTVLLVFLQGFPGCLPWGLVGVFLNDFLSTEAGMSVRGAMAVVTCFNVGAIAGGVVGGAWGQQLYNISPRKQVWLMSLSTLCAIPFLLVIINVRWTAAQLSAVALCGGLVASLNGPNVRGVLQNVIAPELRGTSFAVFTVCDDVGRAAGPALIVLLITSLGRRAAFNVNLLGWAVCALLLFLCSLSYEGDAAAMQESVREALGRRRTRSRSDRDE